MKQFGCFQLDTSNECLWQNGTRIGLTPKPFAVLRYLVENPHAYAAGSYTIAVDWTKSMVTLRKIGGPSQPLMWIMMPAANGDGRWKPG